MRLVNLLIAVSFLGCADQIIIPNDVPLGTTEVYINGKLRNFKNNSSAQIISGNLVRFNFFLDENINNGEYFFRIGGVTKFANENTSFSPVNFDTNNPEAMKMFFVSIYDSDLPFQKYVYFPSPNDYVFFEKFDTISRTFSGRGRLEFKRVGILPEGKNNHDLYVEFTFHDYFEVY